MTPPKIVRGDVWWVELGTPGGHSQEGRRPAIIVADAPVPESVVLIPLTRNLSASRFPHTFVVDPDTRNGLTDRSVALVFQLRHLDYAYMAARSGSLSKDKVEAMDALLTDLLRL